MNWIDESGDNSGEDTPVPISNTEVKLFSADDTWWETAWESRTLPVSKTSCIRDLFFYRRSLEKTWKNFLKVIDKDKELW